MFSSSILSNSLRNKLCCTCSLARLPGSGCNVPGELQPTGASRAPRQVPEQALMQLRSPSAIPPWRVPVVFLDAFNVVQPQKGHPAPAASWMQKKKGGRKGAGVALGLVSHSRCRRSRFLHRSNHGGVNSGLVSPPKKPAMHMKRTRLRKSSSCTGPARR